MQTNPTLPPDTPSTSFSAEAGRDDPMRNFGYTVSAYAVLWVVLLVFVWRGWRRQAALDARLDELEGAIQKASRKPEG